MEGADGDPRRGDQLLKGLIGGHPCRAVPGGADQTGNDPLDDDPRREVVGAGPIDEASEHPLCSRVVTTLVTSEGQQFVEIGEGTR